MTFAFADLPGVVGARAWIVERREGREEQRSLQGFVATSEGMLAADGRARASRDRSERQSPDSPHRRGVSRAVLTPTPGMLVRTG